MAKILTVLHTGLTTVRIIGGIANSLLPADVVVRHVMDDSLLNDTRNAGFMTDDVAQRIVSYVQLAESHGSDCVLFACSSVGPAADLARKTVKIPVLKIDEPMVRVAAEMGPRVAILATVGTTLKPTRELLEAAAKELGTEIEINTVLCDKAFDVLEKGDVAAHNKMLIGNIIENAARADVVVLAQASMTNILPDLPDNIKSKVLTSPRLGVKRAVEVLGG